MVDPVVTDARDVLFCDTECFPNFWSIGFKRQRDGKRLVFEHSHRKQLDVDRVRRIMSEHRVSTFNGQGYDLPMIYKALDGATNAELKEANDRIIIGRLKYWQAEGALGIYIPSIDHVDLIEPQPNAVASLKTLAGRLHCPRMQDLPYSPDTPLTEAEMDRVLAYMDNDIDVTEALYNALEEPLKLRAALGAEYGQNFMSKSDSQIGEAIIKKRVGDLLKRRIDKAEVPGGTKFRYPIPAWLSYERADLKDMVERLRETDFVVKHDGKVDMPGWLGEMSVTIGSSTYAMGIGGLHSTEEHRAVLSDEDGTLVDYDVASYYPAIIINSGLYPQALGPHFLTIYRQIRDERVAAKRAGDKVKAEGLKIALNGCYGKLGSPYSVLYAPHLLIAVTLTGQLALLMLIERAERAGIPVVSANTDGVVFKCPLGRGADLEAITKQWEADTGFELESTEYDALYSLSVNTYIAVKPDGKVKRKGTLSNPVREGDMRGQLMKNPSMSVCSDAVVEFLTKGTSPEAYIRSCRDIRDFVTVVNVKGGGTWRGEYLGKVVRYIWSTAGDEIFYKTPHPTTGNFKKVPKSDGCRPLMDLPEEWPEDIDYQRYIDEANEILRDIGYRPRVAAVKPPRVRQAEASEWLLWSLAA